MYEIISCPMDFILLSPARETAEYFWMCGTMTFAQITGRGSRTIHMRAICQLK